MTASKTSHDAARYTAISLFSGAMGLDIGMDQSGRYDLLAAVEREHAFAETIRKNRDAGRLTNKAMRVYEADIATLDPVELLKDCGLRVGELDVLVGGPPCQTFSTAGRRRTVRDPRGTLIWEFLRFVEVMRPKFFVMENVRGLLSAAVRHRPIAERPDRGGRALRSDERAGSVIRLFAEDLERRTEGAYRLDIFEVNAVNYGAPQLRERVFLVGNRYGAAVEFPDPTHGLVPGSRPGAVPLLPERDLLPYKTLGDAIRGLRDESPVLIDFSARKKHYLAMVPPGGNWRMLATDLQRESMGRAWHAKGGRSGWWRRLSYELPCPTLVTLPNHAGTALCHPEHVRALTVREYAAIQEFPPEWEFAGTPLEQYTQAGNAVPTRLGKVTGFAVAAALDRARQRGWRRTNSALPSLRLVYVRSHVRTRQWFRAGKAYVWQDGSAGGAAPYQLTTKTVRTEKALLTE